MDDDLKKTKNYMLKIWKELNQYYDKQASIAMLEESFQTGKLNYDTNDEEVSIVWGYNLDFLNSDEGTHLMEQIYEIDIQMALAEFKKTIKLIWSQLRIKYDREAAAKILEESFSSKKLDMKVGTLDRLSIYWNYESIHCAKSEEGKIFLQEEIYSN